MDRVTAGTGMFCRLMRAEDVARVVEIEASAFTSPWRADTFHALLEPPGAELWVLDDGDGEVIGYFVLWCILDQGELANIAVDRDYRGRGYGRLLLEQVLDVARSRKVEDLYLEVRISNEQAADLYRRFGFEDVGVRRDYYDNPKEDALLMLAKL